MIFLILCGHLQHHLACGLWTEAYNLAGTVIACSRFGGHDIKLTAPVFLPAGAALRTDDDVRLCFFAKIGTGGMARHISDDLLLQGCAFDTGQASFL